ncbi:MAG TPA: hypothetical protein DCL43_11665 [Chitinophagaceae bacterium]|nr:hypothetical protein [Chitinophagaceae bacterium]HAN38680.1 hypothetical protein [Chitinophagaceae bacterium]
MTGIDSVVIEKAIVHKVGNPTRGEHLKLSANALTLNDALVQSMLVKYFLHAFNEHEQYHFTHISDVAMNEVYSFATAIFEDANSFEANSALLAQFLYSKSTHNKVKEGELYVTLFNEVMLDGKTYKAVGLFKSETKETFLKVFPHGKGFEVAADEGININKLDKGCLIINTEPADGFRVLAIDNTNKNNDTRYWIDDFLQIQPVANQYHHTKEHLQLIRSFVTNEYPEQFEVQKTDQIELMQRSLDYFKTKEQFSIQEFEQEVLHHEAVVESFQRFKHNYQQANEVALDDDFAIHVAAVKKQSKVFKSILKLDKNFHVYIHGRRDLIEKGYDDISGKHYYKLYFDEEA